MSESVKEYVFESITGKPLQEGLSEFTFHKFAPREIQDQDEKANELRIERSDAIRNNFSIAPVVREHRGINKQEYEERERAIEEEVARRVKRVKQEAYDLGYSEGVEIGKSEVYNQTRAESERKIELLTDMIHEVLATQADLLVKEKLAVYRTVRNLTKWVVLRELKDDGKYIERLLEKLVEELQTKSNLLIQVDPKSFADMPEVLESVEAKLGKLEHIRLELDYDIAGPGIIIDSDNGIINGTLGEQFASIDRLFEKVGIESSPEENSELFSRLTINDELSDDKDFANTTVDQASDEVTSLDNEEVTKNDNEDGDDSE